MYTQFILLFFIYSLLGWLLEVIFAFMMERRYINRGCLIGPYCPIYGCGCLLLITLFSRFANNIIFLFLVTFVTCSLLEYLTSWIMEKIFNLRWWDYSSYKFNINGRVCLETMLPFSIFGTLVIKYLNPLLIKMINNMNEELQVRISIILVVIILIDVIFSLLVIKKAIKENEVSGKDATESLKKSAYKTVSKEVKKQVKEVKTQVKKVKNIKKK